LSSIRIALALFIGVGVLIFTPLEGTVSSWAQDSFQSRQICVEGAEDISHQDIASARRGAKNKALQKAVEQSIANLVYPETMAENYQLLIDRIYPQSSKYIIEYKLLTEEVIGDIYRVKIEAIVSLRDLKADLNVLGLLPKKGGKPKIVIMIAESWSTIDWGQERSNQIESNLAEKEIMESFRQEGFIIIERPAFAEPNMTEDTFSIASLDDQSVQKLGKRSGADIIIYGKALTQLVENVPGSTMSPAQANISTRAIITETGKTITACTRTATSIGVNPTKAGSEALRKAATELTYTLMKEILEQWGRRQIIKTSAVQLSISGISNHNDLVKLEKALQDRIPGLQDIYLLSISPGKINLKLEVIGTAYTLEKELINLLKSQEFPYRYELTQLP
jgi:hypothetical protein